MRICWPTIERKKRMHWIEPDKLSLIGIDLRKTAGMRWRALVSRRNSTEIEWPLNQTISMLYTWQTSKMINYTDLIHLSKFKLPLGNLIYFQKVYIILWKLIYFIYNHLIWMLIYLKDKNNIWLQFIISKDHSNQYYNYHIKCLWFFFKYFLIQNIKLKYWTSKLK